MPLSHEVTYQEATKQDDVDKLWPVPLGTVMPNYTVCVVVAGGRVLPAGMPGQLVIGGAGVARGYVDQPTLTAQRFVPRGRNDRNHVIASAAAQSEPGGNMVHLSGVCGYLRAEDGEFMMLGRIDGDTQIKLRGLRIDIREVEAGILAQVQGQISDAVVSVRDLATGASPVTKEGESTGFLAAHVVLSPSAQAKYGIESERVEFLRSVSKELPLPDYMRLTIMISVDGLPLTPNGKLGRKAIGTWPVSLNSSASQMHTAGQLWPLLSPSSLPSTDQQGGSPAEPDHNIEKMKQIWAHALGCKPISELEGLDPQADFFHMGGKSILFDARAKSIKDPSWS